MEIKLESLLKVMREMPDVSSHMVLKPEIYRVVKWYNSLNRKDRRSKETKLEVARMLGVSK